MTSQRIKIRPPFNLAGLPFAANLFFASMVTILVVGSSSVNGADNSQVPPAPPDQTSNNSKPSVLVLSTAVDRTDPIAALLLHGQFQAALDAAKTELAGPTRDMALRLYEQGEAQIGLAQGSASQDLYKDAGLSFMRVVIFYPQSRFAGPSLIEAGVVHQNIGRPDLAAKLWQRAKLQIDEAQEPQLDARLQKLMASTIHDSTQP